MAKRATEVKVHASFNRQFLVESLVGLRGGARNSYTTKRLYNKTNTDLLIKQVLRPRLVDAYSQFLSNGLLAAIEMDAPSDQVWRGSLKVPGKGDYDNMVVKHKQPWASHSKKYQKYRRSYYRRKGGTDAKQFRRLSGAHGDELDELLYFPSGGKVNRNQTFKARRNAKVNEGQLIIEAGFGLSAPIPTQPGFSRYLTEAFATGNLDKSLLTGESDLMKKIRQFEVRDPANPRKYRPIFGEVAAEYGRRFHKVNNRRVGRV